MKKKINPRLVGRSSHIGGPVASNDLNPNELTDEAVREKRAIREEAEDLDSFKSY